jgi:hypothetical protein
MWAANAATVSPAPDTADGKCHLTVANLRTMPHRSHEWPDTLAQLRLAFADPPSRSTARSRPRSATRAPPITCGWRRRMASPGSKCSSMASPAAPSRAPACRSVQGRRPAPRARSGAVIFAAQSERRSPPARSTMTSSRSPMARCCSPTNRPSPTRRRWSTGCGARPRLRICRGGRCRRAARRRDQILSVQRPAGDHARRRDDPGRADRVPRHAVGGALDRAAPWPRTARSAGSISSTSASRWPMAAAPPACACASRAIRDRRSALPGRRRQARPARRGDRAHWPERIAAASLTDPALVARSSRARALLEALDLTEL